MKKPRHWLNGLVWLLKPIIRLLFPMKIIGPRTLPKKSALLVSNHYSGLDPIIWTAWCTNHIHFMYKGEFNKYGIMRYIMRKLEHIPIRRMEADLSAIKASVELIDGGKILAMFPEGTRNAHTDSLRQFRTGAALIAIKTKAPIRPVYIWDKSKAFRKNYMTIGEEFSLEKYYTDGAVSREALVAATVEIQAQVQNLKDTLDAQLAEAGINRRALTKKELRRLAERDKIATLRESMRAKNRIGATEALEIASIPVAATIAVDAVSNETEQIAVVDIEQTPKAENMYTREYAADSIRETKAEKAENKAVKAQTKVAKKSKARLKIKRKAQRKGF